jgi:hypothetical protein
MSLVSINVWRLARDASNSFPVFISVHDNEWIINYLTCIFRNSSDCTVPSVTGTFLFFLKLCLIQRYIFNCFLLRHTYSGERESKVPWMYTRKASGQISWVLCWELQQEHPDLTVLLPDSDVLLTSRSCHSLKFAAAKALLKRCQQMTGGWRRIHPIITVSLIYRVAKLGALQTYFLSDPV